jgi:Flp pilus assembly CpaE family ATPase
MKHSLAIMPERMPGRADDADLRTQLGGEQSARTSTPEGTRGPSSQRARQNGPLLAVCGLCGGAGTSTLSYLIARFAVERSRGDVLVCDTGGPTAGLSAYAGTESALSLAEASEQVALGLEITTDLYAVDAASRALDFEMRVIATGPQFAITGDRVGLRGLLGLARQAHALTVVDCGTLQRDADRATIELATHVAWVLPATASGVRRAQRVLARLPAPNSRELLLARRDRRARTPRLRALRALAEDRRATLVLVPHVPDLLSDARRGLAEARGALRAIDGALVR